MQRIPLTQVQMLISLQSADKVQCVNPGNMLPEFFSSSLYVREFFWENSLVQEIFSYTCALAGYFFQNHPSPPSEVKWLAPYLFSSAAVDSRRLWSGGGSYITFPGGALLGGFLHRSSRDLGCSAKERITLSTKRNVSTVNSR